MVWASFYLLYIPIMVQCILHERMQNGAKCSGKIISERLTQLRRISSRKDLIFAPPIVYNRQWRVRVDNALPDAEPTQIRCRDDPEGCGLPVISGDLVRQSDDGAHARRK